MRNKSLFENETPIDDEMVVLDLLVRRWGDRTSRGVKLWDPESGPYVEIAHHHEHSDSTIRYFLVTQRVVDALLAQCCLAGKPEWGYTDMKQLHATDAAASWLMRCRAKIQAEDYGFAAVTAEMWYVRSKRDAKKT